MRHKYGPCSTLDLDKTSRPSHVEILRHDEERVQSIRERVRPKTVEVDSFELYNVPKKDRMKQKAVGLPAMSGSTIGSGNYIVTIGLGTPKKDLSLIFDTGTSFNFFFLILCLENFNTNFWMRHYHGKIISIRLTQYIFIVLKWSLITLKWSLTILKYSLLLTILKYSLFIVLECLLITLK